MEGKYTGFVEIIEQKEIADGIYSIRLHCPEVVKAARAGQFVSVYSKDKSRLLPRPISICELDREHGVFRMVYRVAGEGTRELSQAVAGDRVRIMGPLGNGYEHKGGRAMVIGGGIGIPPMLELAKSIGQDVTAVLGYRDQQFLREDFEKIAKVYVSTEDGSDGTRGNVINAIEENRLQADVIYACGPTPMLRGVKDYALKQGIPCYVSLEERMGCGIGACLACVCKSKEVDAHTNVHNKRICKEGPVFDVREVEF
ncbi:MAG: dihydroorotate dehydrogenase electron transfer subunit [Lachnospiraceae bacterium]